MACFESVVAGSTKERLSYRKLNHRARWVPTVPAFFCHSPSWPAAWQVCASESETRGIRLSLENGLHALFVLFPVGSFFVLSCSFNILQGWIHQKRIQAVSWTFVEATRETKRTPEAILPDRTPAGHGPLRAGAGLAGPGFRPKDSSCCLTRRVPDIEPRQLLVAQTCLNSTGGEPDIRFVTYFVLKEGEHT